MCSLDELIEVIRDQTKIRQSMRIERNVITKHISPVMGQKVGHYIADEVNCDFYDDRETMTFIAR